MLLTSTFKEADVNEGTALFLILNLRKGNSMKISRKVTQVCLAGVATLSIAAGTALAANGGFSASQSNSNNTNSQHQDKSSGDSAITVGTFKIQEAYKKYHEQSDFQKKMTQIQSQMQKARKNQDSQKIQKL